MEDDPSETTVQNRTVGHDSTCPSSTASNTSDESNTSFKHMKPNISTGVDSNLKIKKDMLQQESTNSSTWPSTTSGVQNVLIPTNIEINVSTANNMMVGQNILETDDSSKESEVILSEIIENSCVVHIKSEAKNLGTSEKNDLNVLINDETGIQTAISKKEKTPESVRDNLENTTGMVKRNVENAQDDKKASEEITNKFVKSSSNEGDKVVEGNENDDLYHVTGVDKENEGQTQLFNATSLTDKEGSPTTHHKTTVACGDGSIAAHQLSCETCVTIEASGKVNYTMFPNAGSQSGHILHQGTTDDQLLRYFEDALHESMTTVCSSPFKENQEVNLDDFVEISLEVKL